MKKSKRRKLKKISTIILIILIIVSLFLVYCLYFKDNKKEEKTVKKEEVPKVELNSISIINYNNISEQCNNKFDCVEYNELEKQIKYLEDKDYNFISIDEFNNWRNEKTKLYNNNVLLMCSDKGELLDKINKKYKNIINYIDNNSGLTLLNDNNKYNIGDNKNSIHNYNIRSNTKFDDFKKMVNGEYVKEEFIIDKTSTSVPVLNYHFFYNPGTNTCNERICENTDTFKSHLNYLKDNNYTVLTMDQYVKWIYGEIEVPEKSVLITIDDGAAGTGKHNGNLLIPILEEYKMHATLFLITGWWDINNYRSSYLEIQSHTYDMHKSGSCGKAQLLCATKEEFSADLDSSDSIIGDKKSFCYPFFKYDDKAIEVLKEKGYKVAFAGTNTISTRNSNKYAIPRFEIFDSTSFDMFTSIVK